MAVIAGRPGTASSISARVRGTRAELGDHFSDSAMTFLALLR